MADGGSKAGGCEEVLCEAVISGDNSAEVFEATEHAFDGVAIAIKIGRDAVIPFARAIDSRRIDQRPPDLRT